MPRTSGERVSPAERVTRRQVDKFEERRRELANGALQTLSELGYARTSLREIAQNTEFSHATLHYYFRDKVELILYCVRQYKAHCAQRYDGIVAEATTAAELRDGFGRIMAESLEEDALMHRLWYDLRSQSLFQEEFRADVAEIDELLEQMVWRIVSRYTELSATTAVCPSPVAYAMFDGLFQHALLRFISDVPNTLKELTETVRSTLSLIVTAEDDQR